MLNWKKRRNQETSALFKEVDKVSKPDFCLLCGKKTESLCNSHVVPQFILREIAENGMVTYGMVLFNINDDCFKATKGINNAYTFKLICRDCDKKRFKNYEEPESIIFFDDFDEKKKKLILKEMAIKSHLSHISAKVKGLNMFAITHQDIVKNLKEKGVNSAYEIDINEHYGYIKNLSKITENTSFPFKVIYNKLLDYKMNIACQTLMSFVYDLKGKQVFNPKDFSEWNRAKYFYLMIFPYKEKTRIIFYIENRYIENVKSIIGEFEKLNDEEKLHFLFSSMITYTEQFFVKPSLSKIMKKDKKLTKFFKKTDINTNNYKNCKELCNFRQYENYFDYKYSDKN